MTRLRNHPALVDWCLLDRAASKLGLSNHVGDRTARCQHGKARRESCRDCENGYVDDTSPFANLPDDLFMVAVSDDGEDVAFLRDRHVFSKGFTWDRGPTADRWQMTFADWCFIHHTFANAFDASKPEGQRASGPIDPATANPPAWAVPDIDSPLRWMLWYLTDYRVTSSSGGSIWLARKTA